MNRSPFHLSYFQAQERRELARGQGAPWANAIVGIRVWVLLLAGHLRTTRMNGPLVPGACRKTQFRTASADQVRYG
jgi:hypothetical protein